MSDLSPPQSLQQPLEAEIVLADEWLTEKEKLALKTFKERFQKGGLETYELAAKPAVEMFSLFLNGSSLSEIADLNYQFGLGTIVNSAVEGKWNQKRQDYLEELYDRAKDRMFQTAAEGANFIATLLSAAHKEHGDKIKKYLQTEDPALLAETDFRIKSMRGYKEAVEVLMKLTGQDRTKQIQVSGDVTHTELPPPPLSTTAAVATSVGELMALKREKK
jgi:hypothetical protein